MIDNILIEIIESYEEFIEMMCDDKISPTVKYAIAQNRKETWYPMFKDMKDKLK